MPGFVKTAGPYLRREIEGAVEYGFIPGPEHLNPVNVVHGGCSFTFTDCALGWEAMRATGRVCVTIHLDAHFINGIKLGDFVTARAEVVRQTSSMAFMRGALQVNGEDRMMSNGVWKTFANTVGEQPATIDLI